MILSINFSRAFDRHKYKKVLTFSWWSIHRYFKWKSLHWMKYFKTFQLPLAHLSTPTRSQSSHLWPWSTSTRRLRLTPRPRWAGWHRTSGTSYTHFRQFVQKAVLKIDPIKRYSFFDAITIKSVWWHLGHAIDTLPDRIWYRSRRLTSTAGWTRATVPEISKFIHTEVRYIHTSAVRIFLQGICWFSRGDLVNIMIIVHCPLLQLYAIVTKLMFMFWNYVFLFSDVYKNKLIGFAHFTLIQNPSVFNALHAS